MKIDWKGGGVCGREGTVDYQRPPNFQGEAEQPFATTGTAVLRVGGANRKRKYFVAIT